MKTLLKDKHIIFTIFSLIMASSTSLYAKDIWTETVEGVECTRWDTNEDFQRRYAPDLYDSESKDWLQNLQNEKNTKVKSYKVIDTKCRSRPRTYFGKTYDEYKCRKVFQITFEKVKATGYNAGSDYSISSKSGRSTGKSLSSGGTLGLSGNSMGTHYSPTMTNKNDKGKQYDKCANASMDELSGILSNDMNKILASLSSPNMSKSELKASVRRLILIYDKLEKEENDKDLVNLYRQQRRMLANILKTL